MSTRALTTAIAVLVAAAAAAAHADPDWLTPSGPTRTASDRQVQAEPTGAAADALDRLTQRRHARPGYEPERFGQRWSDAARGVSGSRNGCDTRSDVLRRDLQDLVVDPRSGGCSPASGSLTDPYTGQHERYRRGEQSSIDVDHVVSLADAWRSGAWSVDQDTRLALANDPLNLLATSSSSNRSKGDRTLHDWPGRTEIGRLVDQPARCRLAARQIAVKSKYELSVTPQERSTMRRVLAECPGQTLPRSASTDVPTPHR